MKKPTLDEETKVFQKQAIKAAKDLSYGLEAIQALQDAKTIGKMNRIMVTARKEKFK